MLLLFLCVLAVHSTNIWLLSGSGNGNIYKSTNNGVTFANLPNAANTNLAYIWAKSATEIWAVGASGIVRKSLDGGTTWSTLNIGTTSNLNQIFWISQTTGWIAGNNYFSRTTDSGVTWTVTTTGGFGAEAMFFLNANGGFAVSGSSIWATSNGGVTWIFANTPSASLLKSIAFASSTTGVAVGISGIISRTTNSGANWNIITSPVTSVLNNIVFTSSTVGWIAHSTGLLKTTDTGASWTTVSLPTGGSLFSIASVSNYIWLGGGSFFTSADSGTSWTAVAAPGSSSPIISTTVNGSPTSTTSGSGTPSPTLYQVTEYFSNDVTCLNAPTALQIAQPLICTPSSTCTNINGNYGSKVSCVTTPQQYPSGWSALEIWMGSQSCQGTSEGILAAPANTCTGKWSLGTIQMNCSNNVILDCQSTSTTCGGCSSKSATSGGGCITGNPVSSIVGITSYKWTCTSNSNTVCFHEDTEIFYDKPNYFTSLFGMKALSNDHFILGDECRIPHVVKSDGVIIISECDERPLRLTPDHLVFTDRGLLPAGKIVIGDIVEGHFGRKCSVTKISSEKDQMYYGLNCIESVVFANGIKCSTFGRFHTLPAFWMKYASKFMGIEATSKVGDFFANLFHF